MRQPADYHIRQTALNTRQSFIVQAPAGSGKTTLLTQRLLRLLAEVEQRPEECLAITFTRKAAGEMRDRILAALELAAVGEMPETDSPDYQTWQLAKNLLKRDRQSGWNLQKNPSRLRIQTVDSLCANIARQMPILSQFGASPAIAEDPEPLYREAARQLLLSMESLKPSETLQTSPASTTYNGDFNTSYVSHANPARDLNHHYTISDTSNNVNDTHSVANDAIATLLKHLDNNLDTAERLLAEMLSFREQWLPHIGLTAVIPEARKLLEKGLQTAIRDILYKLVERIPKDIVQGPDEILILAKYAAAELKDLQLDSPILACQNLLNSFNSDEKQLSHWPGKELVDCPVWLGIAELLLTENNTCRKTVTQNQGFKAQSQSKNKEEKLQYQLMKQRMLEILKALENYPDFCEALQDLRNAPTANYTDNEWKIINALINLLPDLVGHLVLVFQEKGQVDFAEILLAASRALGNTDEPSDLALSMENKIRHILVDEFQDISIPQLKLLEQLTFAWENGEGRTLFLVGDPQQSIYRFRQAEVGLFLQVKQQGIGSIKLKPLTLTANFRSSPQIVSWVNQHFSHAFPKLDDVGTGAIAYTPSVAALEEKKVESKKIKLVEKTTEPKKITGAEDTNAEDVDVEDVGTEDARTEYTDTKDPESNFKSIKLQEVTQESEADALIDLIAKVRQEDAEGSIALLIRSRHHLKILIPFLKQCNIPYQGVEIEPLRDKAILQDLLSLTKALLHLGDRIAWLSLLRSPYCALSLTDLFALANHEPDLPIWWSLKTFTQINNLSQDAISKLELFVPFLEEAIDNRDRYPMSVWIRKTWLQLRSNANTHDYSISGEETVQIQETFFAILEEKGYSNDFYDIEILEKRLNTLYAKSNNPNPKAVQIMTIHKAKGLEFDTVIVAGIGRLARSDREKLLLWESRASLLNNPYLILAPIKPPSKKEAVIYSYLKNENKKRAFFESQRLMYVASTRAKKRLYWLQHSS